jgi:hypothetical protein
MGFWIAAIIAILLAGLATPAIAPMHGMPLPDPAITVTIAAIFAAAGLLLGSRRRCRVID